MRTYAILWLAILGLALYLSGCNGKDNNQQETTDQARRARLATQVDEMVRKHEAVRDWQARSRFSIDLEQCLARSDGRPVLFEAFLQDVRNAGNGCVAHFHDLFDMGRSGCQLWLILSCSHEQARRLIGNGSRTQTVWVIARPKTVERPLVNIAPPSEEGKSIHFDTPGAAFDDAFVRGELVDFLIGEDLLSDLLTDEIGKRP